MDRSGVLRPLRMVRWVCHVHSSVRVMVCNLVLVIATKNEATKIK